MRSLFVKIFLWFWLAMTLIAAIGIGLALTTDRSRAELARRRENLVQQSRDWIAAYEAGGSQALREKAANLEGKKGLKAYLYLEGQGFLAGALPPPPVPGMVHLAEQSERIQIRHSRRGVWVALPADDGYVFVTEGRPPGPLERLLNPYRLTPRLVATFLVSGLVAFLLARSLSAPIRKLRFATRQLAGGDLATRVGRDIPGQDEIGGLAGDFDRMAERIEDLVGSQKRLLRDISHELRSPLARLNVALELARRRSGEGAREALDRIERETERLNELIGQLLNLNLSESGDGLVRPVSVDLESLVREVVADADFEARNRNRSVVLKKSCPYALSGSPELLRQAVENVVRNALRHTGAGTAVEVDLEARQLQGALIRVRDRGPGVPPAELAKIFEPFYRVDEARTRESGGTGIGLAITERAVRLHGGTVTAANAPEGGLVVEIFLPGGTRNTSEG
ncbi:MAG: ATP-binding protein [Desulfuromonadales bacterium]